LKIPAHSTLERPLSCGDCDQNEDEKGRIAGPEAVARTWRHFAWLQAFWMRAYKENVTGMSAMVAYNLMLSVFPFTLLVLFIFSQILRIEGVDAGVTADLQRLFPDAEQQTLDNILRSIENNSATLGLLAALGSIWIGASFWGAMDTAFCRIYHVQCRGWWEQKRFALAMLLVVALFILGSVVLPAAEGALIRSTENLPFGLDEVQSIDSVLLVGVTLLLNFLVAAMIYWLVPKGHMPWRAVWPGALFTTTVAGLANWLFPVYLSNISTLSQFGSTLGFILIALLWFYLVSLTLLLGAVINSLRHEYHDTGTFPYGIVTRRPQRRGEGPAAPPATIAEPYRSLSAPPPPPADAARGNGTPGGNGSRPADADEAPEPEVPAPAAGKQS
jgi:YihY family inner membrane protein